MDFQFFLRIYCFIESHRLMGRHSSDSEEERKKRKKKKKKRSRSRSRSTESHYSSKQKKSKKSKKKRKSRSRSRSRSVDSYKRSRSRSRGRRSRSYDRYYSRSRSDSRSRSKYSRKSRSRSLSRGRYSRSRSRDRRKRRSRSYDKYSRRSRSDSRSPRRKDKKKSSEEREDPCLLIPGFSDLPAVEQAKIRMQMALKAAAAADEKIKGDSSQGQGSTSLKDQMAFNQAIQDIEASGFESQYFKSSRGDKRDDGITIKDEFTFGTAGELRLDNLQKKPVLVNIETDDLADPSLYADPEEKMDRWIKKLASMRRRKLEGEALT